MKFSYPKKEKLCSKSIIDKLFSEQKPVYEHPLKVFWIIHKLPENVPVQSAVTAAKRNFKRANKRNLLKRRMREAFRLNKHTFYEKVESLDLQIAMLIIYNHSKILSFSEIEKALQKIFNKISLRMALPESKKDEQI